jgi:hypothetical protein
VTIHSQALPQQIKPVGRIIAGILIRKKTACNPKTMTDVVAISKGVIMTLESATNKNTVASF